MAEDPTALADPDRGCPPGLRPGGGIAEHSGLDHFLPGLPIYDPAIGDPSYAACRRRRVPRSFPFATAGASDHWGGQRRAVTLGMQLITLLGTWRVLWFIFWAIPP